MKSALSQFIQVLPEPSLLLTRDGEITGANSAFASQFNAKPADFLGKNISEFTTDESEKLTRYLHLCSSNRSLVVGSLTMRFQDKVVSFRCEGAAADTIEQPSGRLIYIRFKPRQTAIVQFTVLNDKISELNREIAQRKLTEESLKAAQLKLSRYAADLEKGIEQRTSELRESNEHMEAFLYSVSHDLRSPLRSMMAFSSILLEENKQLSAESRDYLNRINSAARRMSTLIDNLLEYSRIRTIGITLEPIPLSKIVKFALDQAAEEFRNKNVQVQIREPLCAILANSTLAEQVLVNVITNAAKYVAPGVTPIIEISTSSMSDCVDVSVRDNGIGIAPEHHEKIFKVFERVHTAPDIQGTGIGLAIVAAAMKRMGGSVSVESAVGKGSTFHLRFQNPMKHSLQS